MGLQESFLPAHEVGRGKGHGKGTLLPSFCLQIQLYEEVMPGAPAAILPHKTMSQLMESGRAEGRRELRSFTGSLRC